MAQAAPMADSDKPIPSTICRDNTNGIASTKKIMNATKAHMDSRSTQSSSDTLEVR